MKVFHYTHFKKWPDIKKGSYRSQNKPGLGACGRMGQEDDEAWRTGAICALLEPLPDNWVNNEHFKLTWNYLEHDIGKLLLELDVNPEEDEVFVVDRGHVEGVLHDDKKGIPEKYLHTSIATGERAYMETKIPLKEYLEQEKKLKYSLPEVVITEHFPLEKINISEHQPLLEKKLKDYDYDGNKKLKEMLIKEIEEIPELSSWYKKMKKKEELYKKEIFNPKLK